MLITSTSTTGTNAVVTGGAQNVHIVKEMVLLGSLRRLYQRETTTTTEIVGLTKAAAQAICAGSATLYDYRVTVSSGNASAWDTAFACCGTITRGNYRHEAGGCYSVTLESVLLEVSEDGTNWTSTGNIT